MSEPVTKAQLQDWLRGVYEGDPRNDEEKILAEFESMRAKISQLKQILVNVRSVVELGVIEAIGSPNDSTANVSARSGAGNLDELTRTITVSDQYGVILFIKGCKGGRISVRDPYKVVENFNE